MTSELRRYLDLEKVLLEFEAVDERAADSVRDVMDEVWYGLSEADRGLLDARSAPGALRVLEEVRLPVTTALFRQPPVLQVRRPEPGAPMTGWRSVA